MPASSFVVRLGRIVVLVPGLCLGLSLPLAAQGASPDQRLAQGPPSREQKGEQPDRDEGKGRPQGRDGRGQGGEQPGPPDRPGGERADERERRERERAEQQKAREAQQQQRAEERERRERERAEQQKARAAEQQQRAQEQERRERERAEQQKAREAQQEQRAEERARREREQAEQQKAGEAKQRAEERERREREQAEQQKTRGDEQRQRADEKERRERENAAQDKTRSDEPRKGADDRRERERDRGPDRRDAIDDSKRAPKAGEGGDVRRRAAEEALERQREAIARERSRQQELRDRLERERQERRGRDDRQAQERDRELRQEEQRLRAREERLRDREADVRRRFDNADRRETRLRRLEDIQRERRERAGSEGRSIIEEPDRRVIVRDRGRAFIRHDEVERYRRLGERVRTDRRPDGVVVTVVQRPNGVEIVTEQTAEGLLLRRVRRVGGREITLIDNRGYYRRHGGRERFVDRVVVADVRPPRISIPRARYVVEYSSASPDQVYEALTAEPVAPLPQRYSLEEVRYTHALREYMPRVDLDEVTFDTGSWELDAEAYRRLERLARAMERVLERRPDEMFLIEGHTDAVGSEIDNLTLSDRRAESVAVALSETFGVAPENLTTQGYGEQHLKVETEAAERANRRVAVRRITPLLTQGDDGRGAQRK
jgi:outer membrane protein OmpA-like peptidoglycan-associated protein